MACGQYSIMKSPLHAIHEEMGATFTTFEGHVMPLKYTSIQDEHITVRRQVGVFDVSHMGALMISGEDAPALVSKVTTCNPEKVGVDMGFYTAILREDGTIIDDEVFLRLDKDEYLFIPNAGRSQAVEQWFRTQAADMEATVADCSPSFAILAVQGPRSEETLQGLVDVNLGEMKLFACREMEEEEGRTIISRTGYTGEKGYELYMTPGGRAIPWLKKILESGTIHGIKPIGLGARDTLRLEKGFALAGNEFAGGRTPLEAGLGWVVHWDHDFVGKEALERQRNTPHDRLAFLECTQRGVPRHGHRVEKDGEEAGVVTSGTFSPCLKKGIAMAYLHPPHQDAEVLEIVAGDQRIPARKVKPPFVKKDQC